MYVYVKRLIDVLGSGSLLIVLSPLFMVLCLLNLYYHGSPVLFKQERPGLKGETFCMLKFRTMTNERDREGKLLPDNNRITIFGSFLRKTSLDELPELINVLKGEMSLVGPRPLLKKYMPYYSESEKKRHRVRPGITGYSQVNGRNTVDWDARLSMDVWYVENMSFWLDIKILLKTIQTVFKRENVELNRIPDLDDHRSEMQQEI